MLSSGAVCCSGKAVVVSSPGGCGILRWCVMRSALRSAMFSASNVCILFRNTGRLSTALTCCGVSVMVLSSLAGLGCGCFGGVTSGGDCSSTSRRVGGAGFASCVASSIGASAAVALGCSAAFVGDPCCGRLGGDRFGESRSGVAPRSVTRGGGAIRLGRLW